MKHFNNKTESQRYGKRIKLESTIKRGLKESFISVQQKSIRLRGVECGFFIEGRTCQRKAMILLLLGIMKLRSGFMGIRPRRGVEVHRRLLEGGSRIQRVFRIKSGVGRVRIGYRIIHRERMKTIIIVKRRGSRGSRGSSGSRGRSPIGRERGPSRKGRIRIHRIVRMRVV